MSASQDGYAATYAETHMPTIDARTETIEQMAYAGDSIEFNAGEKLVARRYRHDRWPTEIRLARRSP